MRDMNSGVLKFMVMMNVRSMLEDTLLNEKIETGENRDDDGECDDIGERAVDCGAGLELAFTCSHRFIIVYSLEILERIIQEIFPNILTSYRDFRTRTFYPGLST